MNRTILTTASGLHVDLLNPRVEDIDFDDIAEHLSKENRYNGATPGTAYSVAEHLVRGCDAIFEEAKRIWLNPDSPHPADCAAYFLLHDCPEAYLKDDPTPKKRAIDAVARNQFGVLGDAVLAAFDELTRRFDKVITEAAGLPFPPPTDVHDLVDRYDMIMLATEWRDLKNCPMPFTLPPDIAPLPDTIHPWPHAVARCELEVRFNRWLPSCAMRLRREKIIDDADYATHDGTPVRDGARD